MQGVKAPAQKRIGFIARRYQFKIALTYIAIIVGMLVLLNTYPVIVSQQFVFRSKQSALMGRAELIAATLSGLDTLSPDRISSVMALLDDRSLNRILITDQSAQVLFDNAGDDNALGRFALLPELHQALDGSDVFHSRFHDGAFESRAAMPVMSHGTVIGGLFISESDEDRAALLLRLRADLANYSVIIASIVVMLSVAVSSALTRRVAGLLSAIRLAREGQYGHIVPVRGHDELAELSAQFNELNARLEQTDALRRQFVSDASHELKTPLSSIRLLADSILQTEDISLREVREFVSDIEQEAGRLSRLTEKLMALTRLDAVVPIAPDCVDLRPLVLRAAHMLAPQAQASDVALRHEMEDKPLYVRGGPDEIYQILFNLMENAVKYNRPGGQVRVFLYEKEDKIFFLTDDTGVGIPPEALPKLFDRFYRVDKARSREAGGAGLGLSIVQDTARRLGGEVFVESRLGEGSRFSVSFPKGYPS